jgi:hypothetical protein
VPQKSALLSNLLLVGVYSLVAVGFAAVLWLDGEEAAAVSTTRPGSSSGNPSAERDEAPTGALAQAGAWLRSRGSSFFGSESAAPLFAELQLPESAPAADPKAARRQREIPLGVNAPLNGHRPFPADSPWNRDVSRDPVDPMSIALLASIGLDKGLHPQFGSGTWDGAPIGIPYVVVSSKQPLAPVEFVEYGHESDPGPYPVPTGAPIEGAPNDGDRHVIVIDRDAWKLYELSHAFEVAGGWRADCGAVFDLSKEPDRPAGWTSADAAGLPIFPGLVRYDEVASGEIRHALRFTANNTRRAYVPPASHWASQDSNPLLPPMGMRVRLKADVDISGYPRDAQVILRALKKYGMILADNGSDWFITGVPDDRWDNDAMHTIKQITGSDFEVIRMEGLVAE